jgi:hypothetical protein
MSHIIANGFRAASRAAVFGLASLVGLTLLTALIADAIGILAVLP